MKERDEHLSSWRIESSDGKDGEKGEVLERDDGLKAETKKNEKEKHSNGLKDGKTRSDVQALETHGKGLDVDVIEKIEKKKLRKGQCKKEWEKVRIPDAICAEEDIEKEARKKKRKREKKNTMDDSPGVVVTGENFDKEVLEVIGIKKRKIDNGKKKKLANDLVSSTIEMEMKDGDITTNNNGMGKQIKQPENTKAKKGKKKVSFSGQVEVFPVPSDSGNQESVDKQDKLVQGKRFSAEEDKIIQEAVHNYIQEHCLGEEGLNMVLHCGAYPQVKGCWKDIAKAIPYRPDISIKYRALNLLQRGEKHKWSEEDCDLLRKLQAQHGNQWRLMAEELGRHRWHVKDAWRRLKVIGQSKGQWSQKEYQHLFDLVNTDLRLKILEDEEKKAKHGMLRDNIHWSAISDTLNTRTAPNCCMKWYNQLASPMVAQGLWVDSDDFRLIDKLFTLDASCIEDVDWDNLVARRSGDLCRTRWNQMILHIGNHRSMTFSEQIEILTRRYCPDLIEVREAWENKPVVD